MLKDAFIDLDNAPLGHDYDEVMEDCENDELGVGDGSNEECEDTHDHEVAVLIDGAASPKVKGVGSTPWRSSFRRRTKS
jgi:hypothetical protein